jgi:BatD DUF11 like domain
MKKIVALLFFSITIANVLFAQKLILQASKTKVIVGETFQIQFTLNTKGSNFKQPNLSDFQIYSGPNQSTQMSYINGSMSQSITLSYILAAKKEGKFTIGPASVNANGGTLQSNALVIEVGKGSSSNGNQGNQAATQNPSAPTTTELSDNLFVKTIVNKTKAYQGEQISVSQKIYTRYQLVGFQDVKFPDYSGFWAQDVPMNPQQLHLSNETVNGIVYQVVEIRRSFIFAQRSGKLEIPPVKIDCVIRKSRKPRDIIEQMMGGGYDEVVYTIKSPVTAIEITPLPDENKPANFSGAVGEYNFKAQLNKDNVKANESVNLIITLTGKGNIKLVEPTNIHFPEDFETYDPKNSENINTGANGVSGTKTFDYLVIPRHEGDYKIDQINFSYFDPAKKEYITIPSPEFKIHVNKGDNTPATVIGQSDRKEDLKVLGNDIRYINKSKTALQPTDNYFFGSILFYAGIISPLFLFIGFLFLHRKNKEQNKDAIAVKSRKATKMAKKRLVVAETHLKSNNKELFYAEIFKALYGYISDKLNIPLADLSKEHISETLKTRNVSIVTIQQLLHTLDNCEYARYAPSAVSGDLQTIYNNTVELITKMEDEIN